VIPFEQFVQMLAAHPENHHAIINREGRIIIQGRWGAFTYDTIADFLRAHTPASVPRVEPPQPLQPS
jgi:hypothetical protein